MSAVAHIHPAQDEFAFRYLFPEDARQERWPLDAMEQQLHCDPDASELRQMSGTDLEPCFRSSVVGSSLAGDVAGKLIATVLAVHSASTLTPHQGYRCHASYPSPRSYYPLSFFIADHHRGRVQWIDTRELRLREAPSRSWMLGTANSAECSHSLWVQCDFSRYDALYNLFRKALFALESGHCICELLELGRANGLALRPDIDARGIRIDLCGEAAGDRAALPEHRRFSRERNSGRQNGGLYPIRHCFDVAALDALQAAIREAQQRAQLHFPVLREFPVHVQLGLRRGVDFAPGVFDVGADALQCRDVRDLVDSCERLYSYPNFSFATVPGLVFMSVAPRAMAERGGFLELNAALGYLSQQLIRHFTRQGLFARPFRSYDQHGLDQLLGNDPAERKVYYGLLMGKNRYRPAPGVLR
jgi:hypothetical protein